MYPQVRAQAPSPELTMSEQQAMARLPEGPGKDLVMRYCAGACHDVLRLDESQGTHDEWVTRIRRMIRRGAAIPSDKIDSIATYLAAALPPRVRAQSAHASPIAVTFGEVAVRPIQIWIRAGGAIAEDRESLRVTLSAAEAERVRPGQRVRAFAMNSRSSMLQARVTSVSSSSDLHHAEIRLAMPGQPDRYLVEIITELAPTLSIPTEAIIEEGERQVVYVQAKSGDFQPRVIKAGIQGEQFTQVIEGLEPAERVVTFGSFFIDAEYKLKSGH